MPRNAEPLSLKDPRGFTDDRLDREGESDLQESSGIVSSTADEETSQATFVNLHGGREIGTWFPRSRNPRGEKQKAPESLRGIRVAVEDRAISIASTGNVKGNDKHGWQEG
ncbi:hypothetical protein K0M31_003063 [Melipona bicolor]|uniref:Uncharacterized protein n=1 Tax=Melipona bicolor TaxID=60889 RepID=A0AA40G0E2_9HYME|nr:hypothetical protein K0M31_003063 [Melipona bicolor]